MIVHPNSKRRLAWDLLGVLLIGYDVIVLPLQVFNFPVNAFTKVMGWLSLIFWALDLPSTFFVGYHTGGGQLVMQFHSIARRYLMTWFALDFFLICIDWSILGLGEEDEAGGDSMENLGIARVGKTVRIMRLLRILRLMRLMKLPRYLMRIEEHIQSEYIAVLIGIVKLTSCILIINHIIACAWYAIGVLDERDSWVVRFEFEETSVPYKYTTSLHWSLTQFTPASMEVYPTNINERTFSLFVLVFALIAFSSFVSSITNAMTKLRNMNSEYAKQLVHLSRYIQYHRISVSTAVRVRRHIGKRIMRRQEHVDESSTELLKLLSEPLLVELHTEVYKPTCEHHPFFQTYFNVNHTACRKICHSAICEQTLAMHDVLFSADESCDRLFFTKKGHLMYSRPVLRSPTDTGTLDDDPGNAEYVHETDWLCEHCLWTPWVHVGWAQSAVTCTLVAVVASKFHEAVRKVRSPSMQPGRYAAAFVRYLNTLEDYELTDLKDDDFRYDEALQQLSNKAHL